MNVLLMRNKTNRRHPVIGYLVCFRKAKRCYIELPDRVKEKDLPDSLKKYVQEGRRSLDFPTSMEWVKAHLRDLDRPDMPDAMPDAGFREGDYFTVLTSDLGEPDSEGIYLRISRNEYPKTVQSRQSYKVEEIVPCADNNLLVFFFDGSSRKLDMNRFLAGRPGFESVLSDRDTFLQVELQPGGYGICWGSDLNISDMELYKQADGAPLRLTDLDDYVLHRIIRSAEVTDILNCCRQNVDDLNNRDKLPTIKKWDKGKLFRKRDVVSLRW